MKRRADFRYLGKYYLPPIGHAGFKRLVILRGYSIPNAFTMASSGLL